MIFWFIALLGQTTWGMSDLCSAFFKIITCFSNGPGAYSVSPWWLIWATSSRVKVSLWTNDRLAISSLCSSLAWIFNSGCILLPLHQGFWYTCRSPYKVIEGGVCLDEQSRNIVHVLKKALVSSRVLQLPDFSLDFVVECDLPVQGLGLCYIKWSCGFLQ